MPVCTGMTRGRENVGRDPRSRRHVMLELLFSQQKKEEKNRE
ncbi:MAG: hypothetical protein WBN66_05835 [Smithella sp.]